MDKDFSVSYNKYFATFSAQIGVKGCPGARKSACMYVIKKSIDKYHLRRLGWKMFESQKPYFNFTQINRLKGWFDELGGMIFDRKLKYSKIKMQ